MDASRYASSRVICVGMRQWKRYHLRPLLQQIFGDVHFARTAKQVLRMNVRAHDYFAVWGRTASPELLRVAQQLGVRMIYIEDGFIRSVGLGSDLIRPQSLVLDEEGIYFDPTVPSGLERMLNHASFSETQLHNAHYIREFIVTHQLSKYNTELLQVPEWASRTEGKTVVLVPGQVEDDASIQYGCTTVKTNRDLLKAARTAHPDGFIVYKIHPDVLAKNRLGQVHLHDLRNDADVIETETSIISCIAACDVVHTMTSLTGFDALLREKKVVVYGRPFYAGWGLTEDMGEAFSSERRMRTLCLDELVAGALLSYPVYFDGHTNTLTSCENALAQIQQRREQLIQNGQLTLLKQGFIRRQWRKVQTLWQAMLSRV